METGPMRGNVESRKYILKDVKHFGRVVQSIQSFNLQNTLTDLCFVCARGVKVYAHKLLVCSVSTQLKEMILQMPEGFDMITVHVPDIESRILLLIFDLLYEGQARVSQTEYELFKETMKLLDIEPESTSKRGEKSETTENFTSVSAAAAVLAMPTPGPAPQMVYQLPTSQGGVQYVYAHSPLVQGSLMSPVVQPSIMPLNSPHMSPAAINQVPGGSPILQLPGSAIYPQMAPPVGQMVQPFPQMIQPAPIIHLSPAPPSAGKMLQPVGGPISQLQSHVYPPVNGHAGSSPNQMAPFSTPIAQPSGQVLRESPVVRNSTPQQQALRASPTVRPTEQLIRHDGIPGQQAASAEEIDVKPLPHMLVSETTSGHRVTVQNIQKTVTNNKNRTEINIPGQVPNGSSDQQSSKVSILRAILHPDLAQPGQAGGSGSSSGQASGKAHRKKLPKEKEKQPSTSAPTPPETAPGENKAAPAAPDTVQIYKVLEDVLEDVDIKTLSPKDINIKLKESFGIELSHAEIESVFKNCMGQEATGGGGEPSAPPSEPEPLSRPSGPPGPKLRSGKRRKTKTGSDDEDDEDFMPYGPSKDARRRKRPS